MAKEEIPVAEQRHEAVIAEGEVEVLVKSRERVKAYGEVFTPQRMVNRMLDFVKQDLEVDEGFVDKTVFEPAAGDGNFLIAVLRRKLDAVGQAFARDELVVESLFALASIYGVELLEDNLESAQAGMLGEFVAFHEKLDVTFDATSETFLAANFIIQHNVVLGNTLTGQTADGRPITFSWWHRIAEKPGFVQREPFTLDSLREANQGMIDFTVHPHFAPCPITEVQKELK